VIGLSCDDKKSHEGWIKDIEEVNNVKIDFPIIVDPERKVCVCCFFLRNEWFA
jgi:alkyl hydroperoxide reductase subunit AhpC